MKKTTAAICLFSALVIILYWAAVFLGLFPVTDIVPGYKSWFMAFPVADLWLAILLFFTAIGLLKESRQAAYFGVAAASSMIFLGLYALTYGFVSGTIFNLNTDTIIEICIKVYCLTVGPLLMVYFRKR